ncbi:MAG: hypothetical protein HY327_04535 [Chloroflexi bacterium]|nr:hypothetical protein [Chloroflexota bacterium]
MDQTQTTQMVKWLDEEHRREKAQVAEALDQIGLQYTEIAGLTKTVQDLTERVAKLQSQALRYSQLEQSVGQVKTEVQIALAQHDKRRQQLEEESFKMRQQERAREDQALRQLQLQLEAFQQFQRSITGDHELIARHDLVVSTLQREIEDVAQRYGEEVRRLAYVEEWVSHGTQLTTELHQLSERLSAERAESAEASRRAEQQRARHMAEWSEQMKATRTQMEAWLPQLQEQSKEGKRVLASISEIDERMKQTEPRLTQWQKVVDETRRKERDQLLADIEKRWQQQLGEWTFLRDEWNKRINAVTERLSKLEDWRPENTTKLSELLEKIEKERRERIAMLTDVVKVLVELERQDYKPIEDLLARVEGDASGAKKKTAGN